jgi:hypothetical protein
MRSFKGIGLGVLMALGTLAHAAPASATLTIDGISFDPGLVIMNTSIVENVITAPGQTLSGIGEVLSIENLNGFKTWVTGDNGQELTFQFDNYLVEAVVPITGSIAEVFFSGGTANFYSDSLGSGTPFTVSAVGGQATDIANATDGNLWLTLAGSGTGVVCGGGQACVSADGTEITLQSTIFISGGDLGTITNGFGAGFLDVAFGGGLADAHFDTNQQPSGQDVNLNSDFGLTPSGSNSNWPLDGTADLDLVAVPEPGTLGMLGLGLLGLGFYARRRRTA